MTTELPNCILCDGEVFVCDHDEDGNPIYSHLGYTDCDDPSPANTCRNCDKPTRHEYCSATCEGMDKRGNN